jgi:hypothetical protein
LLRSSSSSAPDKGKAVEVNVLELARNVGLVEITLEVMAATGAKRDHPETLKGICRHQRIKTKRIDAEDKLLIPTRRKRWTIGVDDMKISRGQPEYSIVADLSRQTANITIG